jgi:hypothetical protein
MLTFSLPTGEQWKSLRQRGKTYKTCYNMEMIRDNPRGNFFPLPNSIHSLFLYPWELFTHISKKTFILPKKKLIKLYQLYCHQKMFDIVSESLFGRDSSSECASFKQPFL